MRDGRSPRRRADFEPEFFITGGPYPGDSDEVYERQGAFTSFMLGVLRLGQVTASEVAHLTRVTRRARVFASKSPSEIVRLLEAA